MRGINNELVYGGFPALICGMCKEVDDEPEVVQQENKVPPPPVVQETKPEVTEHIPKEAPDQRYTVKQPAQDEEEGSSYYTYTYYDEEEDGSKADE